jgi:hypothetical protein
MQAKASIKVEDLKGVWATPCVDGVSFEAYEGEIGALT